MTTLEKVYVSDVNFDDLDFSGAAYKLYPFDINMVNYHRTRLSLNSKSVTLLALIENGVIKAVLEHSDDAYDSKLLGIKAGSLKNIFVSVQTSENDKVHLYNQLMNEYQYYLKSERYHFIFSTVENSNSILSLELQKRGFHYILTWGKCFQADKTDVKLPKGYSVRISKRTEDLPFIVNMGKNYFRGGRFYLDPKIDNQKADQMYIDLINNSFENKDYDFSVLYKGSQPIGCFIGKCSTFLIYGLRLLVYNKNEGIKGLPEQFMRETTNLLLQHSKLVESGMEIHNLASLKVHLNAGYRVNYIYSAYHYWVT